MADVVNTINFGTRKDETFCVSNSRRLFKRCRSLIGYSQVINSGSQVIGLGVRTQLTNDALGAETFSTETLWNPINNRINLQDAIPGDYIEVDVLIGGMLGGLLEVTAQLDFSVALDGSMVVGPAINNVLFGSGTIVESSRFTFVFVVTQIMKDNGIGIMITPNAASTFLNSRIMISRFVSTT